MNKQFTIFRNKKGRNVIRLPSGQLRNLSRYLIEYFYDIKLSENQVVHHLNNNREDDNIHNLIVMDENEHLALHGGN